MRICCKKKFKLRFSHQFSKVDWNERNTHKLVYNSQYLLHRILFLTEVSIFFKLSFALWSELNKSTFKERVLAYTCTWFRNIDQIFALGHVLCKMKLVFMSPPGKCQHFIRLLQIPLSANLWVCVHMWNTCRFVCVRQGCLWLATMKHALGLANYNSLFCY